MVILRNILLVIFLLPSVCFADGAFVEPGGVDGSTLYWDGSSWDENTDFRYIPGDDEFYLTKMLRVEDEIHSYAENLLLRGRPTGNEYLLEVGKDTLFNGAKIASTVDASVSYAFLPKSAALGRLSYSGSSGYLKVPDSIIGTGEFYFVIDKENIGGDGIAIPLYIGKHGTLNTVPFYIQDGTSETDMVKLFSDSSGNFNIKPDTSIIQYYDEDSLGTTDVIASYTKHYLTNDVLASYTGKTEHYVSDYNSARLSWESWADGAEVYNRLYGDTSIGGNLNLEDETTSDTVTNTEIKTWLTGTTDASWIGGFSIGMFDYGDELNPKGLLTGYTTGTNINAYLNATTGNTYISGGGTTYIGSSGGTNAVKIEADGTLTLAGDATVFRDEVTPLAGRTFLGSRITDNAAEATLDFADNCVSASDYVYFNVQLNHDRKLTSAIEPHLHWLQASSNVPNWLVQYRWQRTGEAKVTSWTDAACTTQVFTYTSGTIHQITDCTDISAPSGDGVSDIVQIRLSRDTGNVSTLFAGADPLTGDASAMSFDLHVEVDALGSSTEYTK